MRTSGISLVKRLLSSATLIGLMVTLAVNTNNAKGQLEIEKNLILNARKLLAIRGLTIRIIPLA